MPEDDVEEALMLHGFSEAVDHLLACQERIHLTCEQHNDDKIPQDMRLKQNPADNSNFNLVRLEVSN